MTYRLGKHVLLLLTVTTCQISPVPDCVSIHNVLLTNKKNVYSLVGIAATTILAKQFFSTDYGAVNLENKDYYWNWNAINTGETSFDGSFLFGTGTSAYQVEGNCSNTDWHEWEQQTDEHGTPRVKHRSGIACDHWNKFKEDIALMKDLGVGIYRFSLAWDKIEPKEREFDEQAIEHYKDVCNELKKQGIKVLIGFHHYTDPQWFANIGGFQKEENIKYFVAYCTKVFKAFHDAGIEVDLWSTFNSPSGYAFHKYHVGDFPPGITNNKQLTMTVLKNMMEAHVQVYQEAKKINKQFQIGLLKNIMHLDPWRPWHPLDQFACKIATNMTDTCICEFFTSGIFKAKIPFDAAPFMADVEHENRLAPYSVDFIGLNYYSHSYLKNMERRLHPQETLTDNPTYTIYPEGLYRAIVKITDDLAKPIETETGRKIPVYVTENGIAHKDSATRKLFFERYLYALYKAMQDGYDVKGYIYWSFMDNYEWGSYDKKYGLVHVDFDDPELKRTIKSDEGTQLFLSHMKRTRTRLV